MNLDATDRNVYVVSDIHNDASGFKELLEITGGYGCRHQGGQYAPTAGTDTDLFMVKDIWVQSG